MQKISHIQMQEIAAGSFQASPSFSPQASRAAAIAAGLAGRALIEGFFFGMGEIAAYILSGIWNKEPPKPPIPLKTPEPDDRLTLGQWCGQYNCNLENGLLTHPETLTDPATMILA